MLAKLSGYVLTDDVGLSQKLRTRGQDVASPSKICRDNNENISTK